MFYLNTAYSALYCDCKFVSTPSLNILICYWYLVSEYVGFSVVEVLVKRLYFYRPHNREMICLMICLIRPSVSVCGTYVVHHFNGTKLNCLLICACCRVVNIRDRLAKCSKITMTNGIQSKISVCLLVIR